MNKKKMNNIAFLGLGSNIHPKKKFLFSAINLLSAHKYIKVNKISNFYLTKPYGYENQNSFINCVLKIETELTPFKLIEEIKLIEKIVGRKKRFRWGPREIDIDILFYNDFILNSEKLTIPHPDLHNRAFVLIPFMDIEPNFTHPILKKTISELLQDLSISDINQVIKEG